MNGELNYLLQDTFNDATTIRITIHIHGMLNGIITIRVLNDLIQMRHDLPQYEGTFIYIRLEFRHQILQHA